MPLTEIESMEIDAEGATICFAGVIASVRLSYGLLRALVTGCECASVKADAESPASVPFHGYGCDREAT